MGEGKAFVLIQAIKDLKLHIYVTTAKGELSTGCTKCLYSISCYFCKIKWLQTSSV